MGNKRIVTVIPARMGASRFPGKPLAKILGLPLVEHVRRRVLLSNIIDDVVVATCDNEIRDSIRNYGGKAVMTADTHDRCTDRVEEASQHFDADIIVIVQGDEPLFFPKILENLVTPMIKDEEIYCSNIISIIQNEADLHDIDIVKTILNKHNDVMYFSRSPIPHFRVSDNCPMYRQTGISAFTKKFLYQYSHLSPLPLEIVESVDFLRILGHGFSIRGVIDDQIMIGVDKPDDIDKVETVLKNDPKQQQYFQKILGLVKA